MLVLSSGKEAGVVLISAQSERTEERRPNNGKNEKVNREASCCCLFEIFPALDKIEMETTEKLVLRPILNQISNFKRVGILLNSHPSCMTHSALEVYTCHLSQN